MRTTILATAFVAFAGAVASSGVAKEADASLSSYSAAASKAAEEASKAASSQFQELSSLVSELVSGKEPDYTSSIYKRFSSAYSTQYPDLASSAQSKASVYASAASASAASAYASASSYLSSIAPGAKTTTPPSLDDVFDKLNSQLDKVLDAASMQVYGRKNGIAEEASSAASKRYLEASSTISSLVHGSTNYALEASSGIVAAAEAAQSVLSQAVYGSQTGIVDSAKSAASAASKSVVGPEDASWESATMRLSKAAESAQARFKTFMNDVTGGKGEEALSIASSALSAASEAASKAATSASKKVKEEL